MPNSKNTTWIVGYVMWEPSRNGIPTITFCDGRSYRQETYARDRYKVLVDSLKESGYSISKMKVPPDQIYEGIRAYKSADSVAAVFIDRNPVWDPK